MEEIEQYEKHMNLNLLRKLWFDDLGHVWQLFLLSIFCSSKKKENMFDNLKIENSFIILKTKIAYFWKIFF